MKSQPRGVVWAVAEKLGALCNIFLLSGLGSQSPCGCCRGMTSCAHLRFLTTNSVANEAIISLFLAVLLDYRCLAAGAAALLAWVQSSQCLLGVCGTSADTQIRRCGCLTCKMMECLSIIKAPLLFSFRHVWITHNAKDK